MGCPTASTQTSSPLAPKSYKDAMSRVDYKEWQQAYSKEYKGMIDCGAVRAVKPPPGVKILGTTTRTEYKGTNGTFDKRKVRMCVRGDQQVEGQDFFQQDLYAPTLKAQEARLKRPDSSHCCPIQNQALQN